ncbi:MAG: citrate synthase [Actinomycetota bacterium]
MSTLTSREAAARLGVKRATLYAYVSRGLITRRIGPDGRTSRFDPAEIDALRQGRRAGDDEGEIRTSIATAITRVDDQRLTIRGLDLVAAIDDGLGFTEVVDLLWESPPGEQWPSADEVGSAGSHPALVAEVAQRSPLDALRRITAERSAADPLRHDRSPSAVRAAGRSLIVALTHGLPPALDEGAADDTDSTDSTDSTDGIATALWRRLTTQPLDRERIDTVDLAMALLVDHGLAGSTLAARIAASVRADPYSVVQAGLGVLGGTLHGAASGSVHELFATAERTGDAAAAVGELHRRVDHVPGFGHAVYRDQDPRYGALMSRIVSAWGDDPRLVIVYRVRDLVSQRGGSFPNVDLALGALSYLGEMPAEAGEVLFAIARTAGWLAHALEEYGEKPLRFRARATYVGP